MNRVLVPLVLLVAATLAACFSPTFNETTCGVNDACPPGFRCIDGVCSRDGMPTDAPSTVTLTLVRNGNAAGTVTSAPAGIDCGDTCAYDFEAGTQITLTATPAAGATFTRWTGDACSGTEPTCTITLTADAIVNAEFVLAPRTLTVEVGGNGAGMVTSGAGGINCPGACSITVPQGTSVTLTAAPVSGSIFLGWSGGGCTGTGPCTTVVNDDVTVNASFGLNFSLVVTRTGSGTGTITSNPAGINCGTDCDEVYSAGAVVTLTAAAAVNSTFTGWTGGGCSGTGTCTVTISQALAVAADFTLRRHTLTAATTGPGGGTITSSPAGINCGTDCTELYDHGTAVTLTATPDGASLFTGWSGACTGTGTCVVTMDMARNVTATFARQTVGLNVAHFGSGGGTVTSAPAGINCGTDCSETFAVGTMVTLTATPDATSNFAAWSGGGCTGTGTCVVTISGTETVTATFQRNQWPLTVMKTGAGSGTVTSTPAGINCGVDCSSAYDHGTSVVLTATPAPGSRFVQWTDACSGSGTCALVMDAGRMVTAEFQPVHVLTVTRSGSGTGTVSSSPAGINCGADCTEAYGTGTSVTLTATPSAGSRFVQWTGACTGTGACVTTMTAARTVNAEFRTVHGLTVVKAGTGFGTVTSSPAGINCGADCTETYDLDTSVTLNAVAASTPISQDSTFTGWSGGGCSGTGACVVTMSAAQTVTATFSLEPNYAFVTSTTHTGNLGGLTGADAICQARASAASLPGTYRAWLSSDTTSVASRLGTASGWIRPDGKPFALSQSDLYQGREIYPLRLSETGVDLGSQSVWSASTANGMINDVGTCTNWTSAAAALTSQAGRTSALGDVWTNVYTVLTCSSQARLACFGIDRAATIPPLPPVAGRRVFVSNQPITPSNGIAAADAICNGEASAAGLPGTYRALLATTTASAASRFNATGPFIRPDNAVVAVGNALFAAAFWDTSINVTASGFHVGLGAAWTGASSPTALGTVASTCNDWSSSTENGRLGHVYDSDTSIAFAQGGGSCASTFQVYCVQL